MFIVRLQGKYLTKLKFVVSTGKFLIITRFVFKVKILIGFGWGLKLLCLTEEVICLQCFQFQLKSYQRLKRKLIYFNNVICVVLWLWKLQLNYRTFPNKTSGDQIM